MSRVESVRPEATQLISIEPNEVFIGNCITTKESSIGGRLRLCGRGDSAEALGARWMVEADRKRKGRDGL